jgi:hypothetical protein
MRMSKTQDDVSLALKTFLQSSMDTLTPKEAQKPSFNSELLDRLSQTTNEVLKTCCMFLYYAELRGTSVQKTNAELPSVFKSYFKETNEISNAKLSFLYIGFTMACTVILGRIGIIKNDKGVVTLGEKMAAVVKQWAQENSEEKQIYNPETNKVLNLARNLLRPLLDNGGQQ